MTIETILKKQEYNDVIENEIHKDFNSVESLIEALQPKHYIACSIKESGYETNYISTFSRYCIAIGDTYEKCLEAIFIQDNRWSYCNGINIIINSKEDYINFRSYFYETEGISNYAKCGGDMS